MKNELSCTVDGVERNALRQYRKDMLLAAAHNRELDAHRLRNQYALERLSDQWHQLARDQEILKRQMEDNLDFYYVKLDLLKNERAHIEAAVATGKARRLQAE